MNTKPTLDDISGQAKTSPGLIFYFWYILLHIYCKTVLSFQALGIVMALAIFPATLVSRHPLFYPGYSPRREWYATLSPHIAVIRGYFRVCESPVPGARTCAAIRYLRCATALPSSNGFVGSRGHLSDHQELLLGAGRVGLLGAHIAHYDLSAGDPRLAPLSFNDKAEDEFVRFEICAGPPN